jgi:hypothetical protein
VVNSERLAGEPIASLVWGVKSSFLDYVTGVGGSIEVTAPATEAGTGYRFPLTASPGGGDAGSGDPLMYAGAVQFSAHQGLMRLVVTDPWIHRTGGAMRLSIASGPAAGSVGGRLFLADLADTEPRRNGQLLIWPDVPASLAPAGAAAFDFHYPPGAELAAVTFSCPARR